MFVIKLSETRLYANEFSFLGTPAFQCPEIANGEETYSGFCIDIWSCGVTLYNLVTGLLPFEADNIYLLFQTIGKGDYKIPDDVEPHLTTLLHGLLNIDKNSRFTIEQIKQNDWFRRRPPRTFDFLPFPSFALSRFQTFTMYDYLTELHQASSENSEDQQQQQQQQPQENNNNIPDGMISVITSPYDNQRVHPEDQTPQRRSGRALFSCGCSRTNSGDNIHQRKARSRPNHRICSLS